jgi:hypothetical protein
VPAAADRAEPWRPDAAILYTGQSREAAERLSENLLPKPRATTASLLAVRNYLTEWNKTNGGGASVPGEVFAKMGLTFGSNSLILAGLYLETAFAREEVRRSQRRRWGAGWGKG